MYEDQNPRRLLLLRVRATRVETEPRVQLCEHGFTDDRRYTVIYSLFIQAYQMPSGHGDC